jgi:phytoene dehydrogenase-like protein
MGIEDRVIHIQSLEDIDKYRNLLVEFYPESTSEVDEIIEHIKKITHYMEIQYGIDNPIFLDFKTDREYMIKRIVPWMFQYAFTYKKIEALSDPVEEFLAELTNNQSLLDIIAQHFFRQTPASFALSYFKLYLDYYYPLGGTGILIEKLIALIEDSGGKINASTLIERVDPKNQCVIDHTGNVFEYEKLIWAADLKTFYRNLDLAGLDDNKVIARVQERQKVLEGKKGNDSVLTLFLGVDLDQSCFGDIASEHFFYSPSRKGESAAGPIPIGKGKDEILAWLKAFFANTTYEISIPVLRDSNMAPEGKTGLVISVLFDYDLVKGVHEDGWYDEFKAFAEKCMLETLDGSIYPGISRKIVQQFSSTPLTMERLSGNSHGAITGWAFSNRPIPAESSLLKINRAIKTPIPGIFKAGQWTYSPSGFPISLLTGKIAADGVMKELG